MPFVESRTIFASKRRNENQNLTPTNNQCFLYMFPFPSSFVAFSFLDGNIGHHKKRLIHMQEPHNFSSTFIITISFFPSFFNAMTFCSLPLTNYFLSLFHSCKTYKNNKKKSGWIPKERQTCCVWLEKTSPRIRIRFFRWSILN